MAKYLDYSGLQSLWAKIKAKIPTKVSDLTNDSGFVSSSGVTSVRVQATSPVSSSTSTAQTSTLNTTISLSDAYGDTKNPYSAKTANHVLAGPSSGNAATPTFRALTADDIPTLTKSKISDFPTTWALSNITDADDLKAIEALSGTSGLLKKTAANTWTLDTSSYVTSSGVTSVRVQATSPVVSSSNTAQTSTLNTTISLADAYGDTKNPYGNKNANLVLASPSSGNAAAPSFRALVADDLPTMPIAKGGTGGTSFSAARTNLGVGKIYSGTCSTAADVALKEVTCANFALEKGAVVFVTFDYTNSAAVANLQMNVNNTGDKSIKYLLNAADPANLPAVGNLRANQTYMFQYDGTYWVASIEYNSNTTYSAMSVAEARTGTTTTARLIRSDYLKTFLSTLGGSGLTFTHDATDGIILNHTNSVTAKTAAAQSAKTLTWGDTFTIYEEKYDTEGHITDVASYNMTMPSNPNTDVSVNQTNTTTGTDYRILFSGTADDTTRAEGARKNTNLKYSPDTGTLATNTIKLPTNTTAYTNGIQFYDGSTEKGCFGVASNGVSGVYGASKIVLRPILNASTTGVEVISSAMYPTVPINLGTSDNQWQYVYANTFYGDLYGNSADVTELNADQLVVNGVGRFVGGLYGNLTGNVTGNASSATEFSAAKSVALTGDVTGSASSTGGWSVATTLANSGVTAGSYGQSGNASPAHGGTFSVPYFTVDAKGRVTSASTKTITLPGSGDTDVKVTQTITTTNAGYKILFSETADSTTRTEGARKSTELQYNPSTKVLTSTNISSTNITSSSANITELNVGDIVSTGAASFTNGIYGTLTGNVIGTASNATSADSATKATQDGDGNTISSTYLKLSGGTLTGDLTLQKSSTIASNQPSRIIFKTIQTDNNLAYTSAYIAAYDDHDTASNGTNMVIQSGGNVFIGGGESPSALYSNKFTNSTGENTYITADTEIFVQSNCGTIGNRLGFGVNTSGNIIPVKAEAGNNYAQDIGSSSVYWKSLYTRIINQAWTDGTQVEAGGDKGSSASPRYLPQKWSFNHGHNPINGDTIIIKTPGAGHSYGVYLSMNNGTNYYPITLSGTGKLTTHFPSGSYIILVFDSSNSAASIYALAGQDNTTTATVTGGTWRVFNYYDSGNTNTLLRVYASSTNLNVPLIGQNSANSANATWTSYTSSYKDWYGAIPSDDAKRVKINLSTGVLTVPSGISASTYISANAANSGTAGGIALYGTSPASYGIAMRNTTNGGTHGYVTGDWAIYSYMSGAGGSDITGSNNRGWILKNVTRSTNVASISGAGHATFDGSVTTPIIDVTDLTAGNVIVTGSGRFTNGIYGDLTGTATQVSNDLVITLDGGTTEGTDKFTYNGSAAKTVNITDTKNTAGATNSSGTLWLIGAGTKFAASSQTYMSQYLYYYRGLHSDAWDNSDSDESLIDQTPSKIELMVDSDYNDDFEQKVVISYTGVVLQGSPSAKIELTNEGTATFTGLVAPTNNSDAANKKYVDDTVATGVATCVVKPTAASTSGVPYTTSSNTTVTWGTLPVGQGGTGQTSWTQYSLVYASASTTLTSLGVGTSGYVLKTNGSSSAPAWVAQSTLSVGSATTATKLGSSTVGGTDRPIYLSSGTATQTTYRMAGTNATATTALAITDNLNTGIWYVNGTNSTDLYSQTDGAAYVNKYSDNWISEIYQDYRTGQIALRGKNNGTWQPWRKVLDSGNYQNFNSYGELNAGSLIVTGTGRFTNGVISDKIDTRIVNQAWTDGTMPQTGGDKGESANPRYLPTKWSFNHGYNPSNGDIIVIKTPGAGHSYGVYLSMNNGTNYYPITLNGTTRLTTHFGAGMYLLLMFNSSNSAASMYALDGQNNTTTATVTGGTWCVLNFYDSNTNTLLRTYASGTNINVPLLAQSSANSATAAWTSYTTSYKDWYGVISNDDAKRAKINLSTGAMTVPGGITANLVGTASRAVADKNGNDIYDSYIRADDLPSNLYLYLSGNTLRLYYGEDYISTVTFPLYNGGVS